MITYNVYAYSVDYTNSIEIEGIPSRLDALRKKEELAKQWHTVILTQTAWKQATPEIIKLFNEVLLIKKRINQDYFYTKLDTLTKKVIDAKHCLDTLDFNNLKQKAIMHLSLGNIILFENNCVCLTGKLANL